MRILSEGNVHTHSHTHTQQKLSLFSRRVMAGTMADMCLRANLVPCFAFAEVWGISYWIGLNWHHNLHRNQRETKTWRKHDRPRSTNYDKNSLFSPLFPGMHKWIDECKSWEGWRRTYGSTELLWLLTSVWNSDFVLVLASGGGVFSVISCPGSYHPVMFGFLSALPFSHTGP